MPPSLPPSRPHRLIPPPTLFFLPSHLSSPSSTLPPLFPSHPTALPHSPIPLHLTSSPTSSFLPSHLFPPPSLPRHLISLLPYATLLPPPLFPSHPTALPHSPIPPHLTSSPNAYAHEPKEQHPL
ncbi:hypothetical protein GGR10_000562 [Bartonella chomelii]|uniref:Uncharacterized protein n=1 Tax=Bartonella chomelii TaxID=236402 RepID=A0ABR6E2D1_9HYPH|nr:hypothetical protein [Bartonella chomelii]MBA9082721.1 hypothetical protein [Bartonella chomelii]